MATAFAPESGAGVGPLEPSVVSHSPVWAWPNTRRAARLLGVNPATLSRRGPATEVYGQERRVAPTLVLELAERYYRRRDIGIVAAELVAVGRELCPDDNDAVEAVERDVEQYFAATHETAREQDDWLDEARKRLPADLYEAVVRATRSEQPIGSFSGAQFSDDEDG